MWLALLCLIGHRARACGRRKPATVDPDGRGAAPKSGPGWLGGRYTRASSARQVRHGVTVPANHARRRRCNSVIGIVAWTWQRSQTCRG